MNVVFQQMASTITTKSVIGKGTLELLLNISALFNAGKTILLLMRKMMLRNRLLVVLETRQVNTQLPVLPRMC